MRIRDIMTEPVFTVRPTYPVEDAAAMLTDRRIAAMPVIDELHRVVGMVSEGDLLRDRLPDNPTANYGPRVVADVMSRQVFTAWLLEDVADAARTMLEHDVRSMPVLDGGRLVGIVSRRDLLRSVLRTDEVLSHEVQHRLDAYAGGERRWTAAVTDGVARVEGDFDDETEQRVVEILARTVPGIGGATVTQRIG